MLHLNILEALHSFAPSVTIYQSAQYASQKTCTCDTTVRIFISQET